MSTAVPQRRSVAIFGTSDHVNELDPGGSMNQVSPGNGPATSMRPLGMENMWG